MNFWVEARARTWSYWSYSRDAFYFLFLFVVRADKMCKKSIKVIKQVYDGREVNG